ncbi:MAG TPA: hypothetical protein PKV48_06405 [Thermodesulfobacteriota bacterium]|nr:hypothetical protein [Thermodesulfobacteriota bacterium]
MEKHDEEIKVIFDAIRKLMIPTYKPEKKIGFLVKEKGTVYKTEKGWRKGIMLR